MQDRPQRPARLQHGYTLMKGLLEEDRIQFAPGGLEAEPWAVGVAAKFMERNFPGGADKMAGVADKSGLQNALENTELLEQRFHAGMKAFSGTVAGIAPGFQQCDFQAFARGPDGRRAARRAAAHNGDIEIRNPAGPSLFCPCRDREHGRERQRQPRSDQSWRERRGDLSPV